MNPLLRVVAVVAALFGAACAELPRAPDDGFEFELAGRFTAQYRGEAATGILAWRHQSGRDDLLLSSPFGQGLARISRDGEVVTLVAGDDKRYAAADAEIGAHLGEVLWQLGQGDEARRVWQEAQKTAPENETLLKTIKKFRP